MTEKLKSGETHIKILFSVRLFFFYTVNPIGTVLHYSKQWRNMHACIQGTRNVQVLIKPFNNILEPSHRSFSSCQMFARIC